MNEETRLETSRIEEQPHLSLTTPLNPTMLINIRTLETNIVWIYQKEENCVIIDPGAAKPIMDFITDNQRLKPLAILITHHHYDHTAGVQQYMQTEGCLQYIRVHNTLEGYSAMILSSQEIESFARLFLQKVDRILLKRVCHL